MEYRYSEGVLVIEPGSELDHCQAVEIIRCAEGILRQRQVKFLVFDMKNTVFMDSAGVGMMIGLYREMQVRGGQTFMMHMQKRIRRIYQMAGLEKIITCYEDEAQVQTIERGETYEG
jgi:stage II sporulation protein AA (anti-sigma F factor antagonist)